MIWTFQNKNIHFRSETNRKYRVLISCSTCHNEKNYLNIGFIKDTEIAGLDRSQCGQT